MDVFSCLEAHRGAPVTAEQIVTETGKPGHLVRAILREADERGWVTEVPGEGWRLP